MESEIHSEQKEEEVVVPKEGIKIKRGTKVMWDKTKGTTRQNGPHLPRAKQRMMKSC